MKMFGYISQGAVVAGAAIGVVMLSGCLGGIASAQQATAQQATTSTDRNQAVMVTIQVLDGRSGKPITAKSISVECLSGQDGCKGFMPPFFGDADDSGVLKIAVPSSATELVLDSSQDEYEFCGGYSFKDSRIALSTIRSSGVLGKNNCKKLSTKKLATWNPVPGRLVVFTHRKPWWIRMFPYC